MMGSAVFLVIIAAAGGIDKLPMESFDSCYTAAALINAHTQYRVAAAYCIGAAAPK